MHQLLYKIGYSNPGSQLIEITFTVKGNSDEKVQVQLPSWRPGRYELGNFAKNIRSFRVEDVDGKAIHFHKIKKDLWEVECGKTSEFSVIYTYYAAELNAGSSYLDDAQLYVNPVNCCVFIPERMNEACRLEIVVPSSYQIATNLKPLENLFAFECENFDQLADSPFIASAGLQHLELDESEHIFHLWFMGDVQPDWQRLSIDFRKFCKEQLLTVGNLPGRDYHFLFQILPVFFYHGVEHTYSTVCALGPGNKVFSTDFYDELLGVSSHELFHAWNIKTIRPSEMSPYDFTYENYSRLGWVYEGITTWYGDQFLLRSGVFDSTRYLKTLNDKLKRHFTNYGRFNQPVAEASFDTWLDGYVPGIPNRKTSIYVEGSLITFMIDSLIREKTIDEVCVDELIRRLYQDAQKGISYSKESILNHLKEISTIDFSAFYSDYIDGTKDFEPELVRCFERIGMNLKMQFPFSDAEHRFGFKILENAGQTSIALLAPGSPAEQSGLMVGDIVLACDNRRVNQNWSIVSSNKERLMIHVFSREQLKVVELESSGKNWFVSREIEFDSAASENQKSNYKKWAKQDYPI